MTSSSRSSKRVKDLYETLGTSFYFWDLFKNTQDNNYTKVIEFWKC